MRCTKPLDAWQLDDGRVVFSRPTSSLRRELMLPCGQCMDCRLARSREWATRVMHESQMHETNVFVTLTYNDESLPGDGSLRYDDYSQFMRRLRYHYRASSTPRFYMCGEYGERTFRPHYHACLFGVFFSDRQFLATLPSGSTVYTSPTLERLWPHGFSSIGDVTFESAAYVARYICKKVTGPTAPAHYTRVCPDTGEVFHVKPEFSRMSLKPGIGATWYAKYKADIFPRDHVTIRGGIKTKVPRYYDKLLKAEPNLMSDYIEFLRQQKAQEYGPVTDKALADRAAWTEARLSFKRRSFL